MIATLEGDELSAARPGRNLPLRKTRYSFYRRLGGPQGRSGRAENLVTTGTRFRTVQPVVSRYTDCATQPTVVLVLVVVVVVVVVVVIVVVVVVIAVLLLLNRAQQLLVQSFGLHSH